MTAVFVKGKKKKQLSIAVEFCHFKRPKVEDTQCGYNSPPLRVDRLSGFHLFRKVVNQLCALGIRNLHVSRSPFSSGWQKSIHHND